MEIHWKNFYQDDILWDIAILIRLERKWHYEFGYGLSYTDFEIHTDSVEADEDQNQSQCQRLTNTGTADGKEVVEVYFSAPDR